MIKIKKLFFFITALLSLDAMANEKDSLLDYLSLHYQSDTEEIYFLSDSLRKKAFQQNDSIAYAQFSYHFARATLIKGDVEDAISTIDQVSQILIKHQLKELGSAYNIMAISYARLNNLKVALSYHEKSLAFDLKQENMPGVINTLNNMALILIDRHKLDSAEILLTQAQQFNESIENMERDFYLHIAFAYLYNTGKEFQKTIDLKDLVIEEGESLKAYDALATFHMNIGEAYQGLKQYEKAEDSYETSQQIALQYKLPFEEMEVAKALKSFYTEIGNKEKALIYTDRFHHLKDSLYEIEKITRISQLEKQLELKEKQDIIIQRDLRIAKQDVDILDAEKKSDNLQMIIVLLVFGGGFIAYSYFQKKKANQIILHQKEQVESQKNIIEEKNEEINSSLRYAKRIQTAMLSSIQSLSDNQINHSLFYQPKDIVSGDFYWSKSTDKYIYVAVADCTGHGVPGAFMSFLGLSYLNQIIEEKGLISADEVLEKLKQKVVKTFDNSETDINDGMDISLIRIDRNLNKIQYAGANNPLWIQRKNKIEIVKADKLFIGQNHIERNFTSHTISIEKGDRIILFTDGYADQFGGEKGKKLKYKPLQDLILQESNNNIQQVSLTLKDHFRVWKGDQDQVDDVCILLIEF